MEKKVLLSSSLVVTLSLSSNGEIFGKLGGFKYWRCCRSVSSVEVTNGMRNTKGTNQHRLCTITEMSLSIDT